MSAACVRLQSKRGVWATTICLRPTRMSMLAWAWLTYQQGKTLCCLWAWWIRSWLLSEMGTGCASQRSEGGASALHRCRRADVAGGVTHVDRVVSRAMTASDFSGGQQYLAAVWGRLSLVWALDPTSRVDIWWSPVRSLGWRACRWLSLSFCASDAFWCPCQGAWVQVWIPMYVPGSMSSRCVEISSLKRPHCETKISNGVSRCWICLYISLMFLQQVMLSTI